MSKRKSTEVYGPLQASWTIQWSDSRGCGMYRALEGVRSEIAYFRRDGRKGTPTVMRTESCPVQGCHGDGTRASKRRACYVDVTCVGCRGRHDTEEDASALEPLLTTPLSLNDALRRLGLEHAPIDYGRQEITFNGWPMHRGTASSTWQWLRETGRIL